MHGHEHGLIHFNASLLPMKELQIKNKNIYIDMNIGSCHLKETSGPWPLWFFQLQKINASKCEVSIRIYIEWEKDIRQMLIKQEKCEWDDKVTANQTRKKKFTDFLHYSFHSLHSRSSTNKQRTRRRLNCY